MTLLSRRRDGVWLFRIQKRAAVAVDSHSAHGSDLRLRLELGVAIFDCLLETHDLSLFNYATEGSGLYVVSDFLPIIAELRNSSAQSLIFLLAPRLPLSSGKVLFLLGDRFLSDLLDSWPEPSDLTFQFLYLRLEALQVIGLFIVELLFYHSESL